MTVPVYPFDVWIWAAFDPVLIAIALVMGWKSDQFVKVILVSLMAFAISVMVSWAVTAIGIPWPAPISHDGPTFFPIRWMAGFLWGTLGFLAHQLYRLRA
ncbi:MULTISPECIES: hypothetical protein [Methylobacterium]|jgi:hypothetical protein|uniref:Uncharacterized protein n=1 Tax=Methylobacterium bullatum TaxID=570505 RepID=A0A679K8A1_9HYPH|nr:MULTISPECIES: hypothetical protein [Methylobacterium]KQO41387.1 hypothetical protein ASF08_13515 [Methylobacterium sp. Leaf85]KQP52261.1 hypothetical protein ASF34_17475 [Methylobacterium sp. Leaf106]MBD8903501.1 hypothetical protein [Methylobacterium bullatum]TXN22615.1 hypothetical protein FV220_21855 [Methylobacterium sp. WL19]CAA2144740.1 hypothetical protein MBLL_03864 [Methylobacterium bullatum]